MDDATTLLFDLPGFRVVSCEEVPPNGRRVVVMQTADEHACPRCGVLVEGKAYDVRESRVKDLPMGHRPLEVMWRKRRYRCVERGCPQRVLTERSGQIPPRRRLTARLRAKLESAASRSARALSDVAAEYGVSWWSVHRALVAAAVACAAAAPPPVRMLGVDETRARSLRWGWGGRRGLAAEQSLDDELRGPRHWAAGLAARAGPGPLRRGDRELAGRAAAVLAGRIEVVALDPSAPFAAALRGALPQATLVVDHWHLVRLANQALTEVRQRVARESRGRRGRKADTAWAHRRLLLAVTGRTGLPAATRCSDAASLLSPPGAPGLRDAFHKRWWSPGWCSVGLFPAWTTHSTRSRSVRPRSRSRSGFC